MTTFVCGSCGSHSEGARSRDIHDASHMLRRTAFYHRAVPHIERAPSGPFCMTPRPA